MKDVFGKELEIGCKVIFVHGKNRDANLEIGEVTKFYKGAFGRDECSVNSCTHIQSNRVARIDKL